MHCSNKQTNKANLAALITIIYSFNTEVFLSPVWQLFTPPIAVPVLGLNAITSHQVWAWWGVQCHCGSATWTHSSSFSWGHLGSRLSPSSTAPSSSSSGLMARLVWGKDTDNTQWHVAAAGLGTHTHTPHYNPILTIKCSQHTRCDVWTTVLCTSRTQVNLGNIMI